MDNLEIKSYLLNIIKNSPKLIESKIVKNDKFFNKRKEYYIIKEYIDSFLEDYNNNKYIIMPGLRGVGKTTIIYQLFYYLVNEREINTKQILYLNLDRLKDKGKINLQQCFDIFIQDINEEEYQENKPLFIFVDETQHVNNWGLVGKIIYDETVNVFLLFTGSNALNLLDNKESARRSLKREVSPLTFSEYLNLKYYHTFAYEMKEALARIIFQGDVEKAIQIEKKVQYDIFTQLPRNIQKEWEFFIQFGQLPYTLFNRKIEAIDYTLEMKDRIIEKDIPLIKTLNTNTIKSANPLLNIIATQKPGTLSQQKLADNLNVPKSQIRELLNVLEKTLTIFHIEPFGTTVKRTRKSWEYYYSSTQIKACIYLSNGEINRTEREYWGIILENMVASSLFNLKRETFYDFNIYFDERKGGVDFLVNTNNGRIIPIEVGIGKKSKRQIMSAINHYKAEYGIIVSNTTDFIKVENKIIYIPYIIFSLF